MWLEQSSLLLFFIYSFAVKSAGNGLIENKFMDSQRMAARDCHTSFGGPQLYRLSILLMKIINALIFFVGQFI